MIGVAAWRRAPPGFGKLSETLNVQVETVIGKTHDPEPEVEREGLNRCDQYGRRQQHVLEVQRGAAGWGAESDVQDVLEEHKAKAAS